MKIRQHFLAIKRQFFPRWDRNDQWRITTRSTRNVDGRCDVVRRIIATVAQYDDAEKQDVLLIHEICHAVASTGYDKKWYARMGQAAARAAQLKRHRLAQLLREEVVDYQEKPEGKDQAYQSIENMLWLIPSLTRFQIKRQLVLKQAIAHLEASRAAGAEHPCLVFASSVSFIVWASCISNRGMAFMVDRSIRTPTTCQRRQQRSEQSRKKSGVCGV